MHVIFKTYFGGGEMPSYSQSTFDSYLTQGFLRSFNFVFCLMFFRANANVVENEKTQANENHTCSFGSFLGVLPNKPILPPLLH